MAFKISADLEKRLLEKARQENCTVEVLLEKMLERDKDEVDYQDPFREQKAPHQQNEALRQSRARLQGVIDSQIDLVCRYRVDTVLTFANDAYCAHFGVAREALLGRSFLPLGSEEHHSAILARIEAVKRNPAPAVLVTNGLNGLGEMRYIQWVDYGITDADGQVIEIQAVGRDITDLIKSQNALRQHQELLQTILDNIPIMLVLFDQAGQFEFVNQYWIEMLGWSTEEMKQHPDILSAFYPDPEVRRQVLEYMTLAEPGWRDFEVVARDGSILETTWANVRLSDGRAIGIGQDIKHRKELENQYLYAKQLEIELKKERELRELKDRFLSMVSHEYRTPLTVINVYIGFLTQRFQQLPEEEMLDKLGKIGEQVQRMVTLLEDILKYSKGNAGKTEFYPQKLSTVPFFKEIVEDIRVTDERKHHIVFEGDEGDLYADPKLVKHILHNLLSNALKYSAAGALIRLAIKKRQDHWKIIVEDTGIGIPADEIGHLFEPFHRARNAQSYSGTGLGLAIVKDYVDIHGGTITVESEESKGSKFTVQLPL